ncbi:hypothetical protein N7539_009559 [Penicillium diatomitis]|uniref:Uncharacterized protein n=1 Tax=Penicillium diatomitis TaxID=2819901 RepID=A0A9X0BJ26_9EURO|nr:uncharacterized protein N7539_009559 [Penicillium diatomitis]KAJ5466603.1 hypothetical protein N7539_009559 [Penicillium diatomitis]
MSEEYQHIDRIDLQQSQALSIRTESRTGDLMDPNWSLNRDSRVQVERAAVGDPTQYTIVRCTISFLLYLVRPERTESVARRETAARFNFMRHAVSGRATQ